MFVWERYVRSCILYFIMLYICTYIHKYISKIIMRLNITISIESEVLEEFDSSRGELSRGDFIEELLRGWRGFKSKLGEFSTEVSTVGSNPSDTGSNPVAPAKKVYSTQVEPLSKGELYHNETQNPTEEFKTYFKKDGKQK